MTSTSESRAESRPTAAALQEEERVTFGLFRFTKPSVIHWLGVSAKVNERDADFVLDSGSFLSLVGKGFVRPSQIKPCATKELHYCSNTVTVLGEATLPLTIDDGRSRLDTAWKFMVTTQLKHQLPCNMFGMDFLAHFGGDLDMDALTLTLSRTEREPQEDFHPRPFLKLPLTVGQGKAVPTLFLVDTGARTYLHKSVAKERGMALTKRPLQNSPFACWTVQEPLSIDISDSCFRALKGALSCELGESTLGHKDLKRTLISFKDWSMTFRSHKGDVTIPFLRCE